MTFKIKSLYISMLMLAFLLAARSAGNIESNFHFTQLTEVKKEYQAVVKEADGSDTEISDEELEEDDYSIFNGFNRLNQSKNFFYNGRLTACSCKLVYNNALPLYILYNQLKVYS